MRNKTFLRAANCFIVFTIVFYTCGWTLNPREIGPNLRKHFSAEEGYKSPLLPYIKLEGKMTQNQFFHLINNFSDTQKKTLFNSFAVKKGKEVTYVPSTAEITNAMHAVSRHWATRYFTDFNYHETVKWTARQMGVHKTECEYASTFQLEHRIFEKVFSQMWDKLSEEQRTQVLKEANLPSDWKSKTGYTVCSLISTTIAGGTIMASTMGFAFYILMAKTVVVAAAALGIGAATTITTISILTGPVGWGIALACWLPLIGKADVRKCAAFIMHVHATKIDELGKSGVDISKYLLK